MNIQPRDLTKSHFTNPENSLSAGRLQHSPSLYVDDAVLPSAREQQIPKLLLAMILVALLGGVPSLAIADIININPIKDNTLYEFDAAEGDTSNALGNHFFAGETGMGELRRGVLAFDIAGNIPAGSTILDVTLSLNMSRTADNTARTIELHKLLADWGEG